MENTYKEVYFDQYCKMCAYYEKAEFDEPCCRCLEEPTNLYSHKPVEWKEKG